MKKIVMFAVLGLATTAYAQTPMPLSRAVVSDEVAGRTLMKMQINATVARQLVDAVLTPLAKAHLKDVFVHGVGRGELLVHAVDPRRKLHGQREIRVC